MKKRIAILTVLLIIVCLMITSCNQKNDETETESSIQVEETNGDSASVECGDETEFDGSNASADNTSELYKDCFAPYVSAVGALSEEDFLQDAVVSKYEVEQSQTSTGDIHMIKLYEPGGDHVSLLFFPTNMDDSSKDWNHILATVGYINADETRQIARTDQYHSGSPFYTTYDENRTPTSRVVGSLDEVVAFMFDE